ncbi:hypothetical protein ILYODFUR_027604 [Ilyodon furcidens]|uniref:Uncharacterized protein n=1 Tax=Ilyodon furcidens TaxID=33524 RepID=A0ABV0T2C9_9TELE
MVFFPVLHKLYKCQGSGCVVGVWCLSSSLERQIHLVGGAGMLSSRICCYSSSSLKLKGSWLWVIHHQNVNLSSTYSHRETSLMFSLKSLPFTNLALCSLFQGYLPEDNMKILPLKGSSALASDSSLKNAPWISVPMTSEDNAPLPGDSPPGLLLPGRSVNTFYLTVISFTLQLSFHF